VPSASTPERPELVGVALLVALLCLGVVTPLVKLVTAPVLAYATVRTWLTLAYTTAVELGARRRPTLRILRRTALPGVMTACTLLFSVVAVRHGSVAVLVMVTAMQPGVLSVVGGRWLGEEPSRAQQLWTAVGVAGVVVTAAAHAAVRTDAIGLLFCVLCLISYSIYAVANRTISARTSVDPRDWMFGTSVFAALTVTPFALATSFDAYRQLGLRDLLVIVGLIVSANAGFSLVCWAYRFVTASRTALIMLGQTVVAIVVAWPMHHEPISAGQAIGGAIVLTAVAASLRTAASAGRDGVARAAPAVS
jgi:drug/metabolite transporter (DMT)-like permease